MRRVGVLAFMLAAGPAFGQPLPNFSIEKRCEEFIPPQVRRRCLNWATASANMWIRATASAALVLLPVLAARALAG
jgi:hypothetical protein